jgi:hypothetical protein
MVLAVLPCAEQPAQAVLRAVLLIQATLIRVQPLER